VLEIYEELYHPKDADEESGLDERDIARSRIHGSFEAISQKKHFRVDNSY
jgi:hypothetical protein